MLDARVLHRRLLILAALLFTVACDPTRHFTDQDYLKRAKEFKAQGKVDSAVIDLKNAAQKNPKNSEVRLLLGEIYADLGNGEYAEAELKRARELGADAETLKVPMGQALLLQGLYARVLAEIRPGPNTPPANIAKILEIEGRAQHGLRHFEEGCALFVQSLDKDPQYVPGYWGIARCAAARGEIDEARADLSKAIKLDEENSATWAQIGDLERLANNRPAAESAYAKALNYKSTSLDALLGRAAIRIDNNEVADASKDVDAAFKIAKDDVGVNHMRGVVQFKQGKFADAQLSFENVLKSHPNYLPTVAWLGLTYLAQKNDEQAAKEFYQYVHSVPSARMQALLGLAQARLGRREDAEETLKVFNKIDVADLQSLVVLAQAHLTLGETDLAAAYLAKAVEKKPEAAELRVSLASTLSKQGETAQAIAQLENAVHLDPGSVAADVLLIQTLIRDKQFDKAMIEVESLEKKQPKNPTTFILKGAVYLGKKDVAGARKSFEQALALDATSAAAAMNLAQLDLLEKNPEAARQRFQTILAKDKANAQAMMGLAEVATATGQESEFVAWLQKACDAAPSAVQPRLLLARYYLQKNDVRRASTMAQDALTVSPTDVRALDLLGTAQLAAGERQTAVLTFSKLARALPTNPLAYYKLATAQLAAQEADSGIASLRRALALKPDYLDAAMLLASAELRAGHYGQALTISQQIQKQHPESATGLMLQGDVLMAQRQFAPALKAYEKALAINNNSGELAIKAHHALAGGGNAKEADARLVRWIDDHPGDLSARHYMAANYAGTGDNKHAIEQYRAILQIDPKNILALNNLAWLYQQEKDARAVDVAEQAYALRPDSAEVMDTLGWILAEGSNTARALELLHKAVETDPTSTTYRYHWAATLAKSGDREGARRELADLLTKNKTFPHRQEAQALLRQL